MKLYFKHLLLLTTICTQCNASEIEDEKQQLKRSPSSLLKQGIPEHMFASIVPKYAPANNLIFDSHNATTAYIISTFAFEGADEYYARLIQNCATKEIQELSFTQNDQQIVYTPSQVMLKKQTGETIFSSERTQSQKELNFIWNVIALNNAHSKANFHRLVTLWQLNDNPAWDKFTEHEKDAYRTTLKGHAKQLGARFKIGENSSSTYKSRFKN